MVDSAYVGNFTRIYTKLKLFAPLKTAKRRRTAKSYLGNKITRFLFFNYNFCSFSPSCSLWFLLWLSLVGNWFIAYTRYEYELFIDKSHDHLIKTEMKIEQNETETTKKNPKSKRTVYDYNWLSFYIRKSQRVHSTRSSSSSRTEQSHVCDWENYENSYIYGSANGWMNVNPEESSQRERERENRWLKHILFHSHGV